MAPRFDSLVWDNHTSPTLKLGCEEGLSALRRHRQSGVDVVSVNVGFDLIPWSDAIELLSGFRRWLRQHDGEFILIENVADIEAAQRQRKLGVTFNLEGGSCLNDRLSMVSLYYELGVRWMLFAYNRNTSLAGGCQDEDCGLTEFGLQVLREMERVGMVVCCSHVGHQSAMQIMEHARHPVIFSHSNPRALFDHPRNIRDEAIVACAQTGGVIGINGVGVFLGGNDARTDSLLRHIDYVASLVGSQHVGLGLDYAFDQQEVQEFVKGNPRMYPPAMYPDGINMAGPEQIPEIADGLARMGYTADDIANIMGGSHMRIARRVWK